MVRMFWGVLLVFFITGCGGFSSNNGSKEPFTLFAPAHTNSTSVHISGSCDMSLEDPTITVTGNFSASPLSLTCTDGMYEAHITIDQALTNLEATQDTYIATAQINFDTTPPAVAITNPVPGTFVGVQVSVLGTCEADLPVALTGDLQNNVNTTCNESGSFTASVQFNLLPTVGSRSLTATQTDLAGNLGSSSATYDFDNTVPGNPTLTLNISAGNPNHPSTPQSSADNTPTLTGSVNDADGGTINIFSDAQCATTAIGSQTIPSGGNLNINNITLANDGSADGIQRFYARVTGVNGVQNPGGCYNTLLSYRLDTTPPVITVASPQSGQSLYSGSTQIFSGACETGTPVEITLAGNTHEAPCNANTFSTSLTLPATTGSTSASFSQTDLANLSTSQSVTFTLTLGPPTNPEVAITSPATGSLIDVSSPITVSGTCTSHPVMSSTITFTGDIVGTTTNCISDGSAYGGNFSTSIQFSTVASPSLTATQIKTDTNTSYTSTVSYQVAPADPTSLTLNVDPGHPSYTTTPSSSKDNTPTITGTVSLAALGTLSIYSNSTCSSLIQTYNVPANGNVNITSINYQNNGSDDGDKTFYAILQNTYGTPNAGGCIHIGSYKLDTIAPTISLTSHTNGNTYYLESLQEFSGNCETNAPIQLTVGTNSYTPACTSGGFNQNVLLPSTGSSINLTLVQTDAANNSSQVTHTYTLALAPASSITITIDTPAQNSVVNPAVPTAISGTCTYHDDMTDVSLTGDISAPISATCVSDGSAYGGNYTANVTFDSVSTPTLTASQTNTFDNESNSASKQYRVAPTDPVLALTLDPTGPLSKDTTPLISGTVERANNGTIQIYEDTLCTLLAGTATVSSTGVINLSLNYNNDGSEDGLHSYYAQVTALNGSNNPSGCFNTGLSYTLDTIPPALTLTSHLEGQDYYAGVQHPLIGACEINPLMLVSLNVGGVTNSASCDGGSYNLPLTFPSTTGSTTISFSQSDAAGNTALGSITVNLILPPPSTVNISVVSPANGSTVTHLMETTISGTCAAHPGISDVEITGAIQGTAITPCVSDGSPYGGTFETEVIFTPVTTPSITAKQTNTINGITYPTTITYVLLNFDAVFTMNLDPGNPNIPSDPPESADTTPSITGTLPEAEGLTLSLFEDALCTGTAIATQTVPSSGAIHLAANYNNDGSDDGLHAYYARVSSGEFYSDCLDLELSYVLDTQAPNVNLTSHTDANSYLVSSNQILTGTCESGLNVSLNVGSSSYTLTCSNNSFAQTVTFPSSPGTLAISYSQTDAANNSTSKSLNLTIETQPPPGDPVIEFDVVHGNPNLPTTPATSSQSAPVFSGTVSNADGAILYLYDNNSTCTGPYAVLAPLSTTGEFFLTDVEYSGGPEQDVLHHYYVKVVGAGGITNPSGCMDTGLSYYLDRSPPEPMLFSPLNNFSAYATSTLTFSGACETGAPVKFHFNSTIPLIETTDCIDEEFSIDIALPVDVATIQYYYESIDAAGNESGQSDRTIILTLPPPPNINIAITSPVDNSGVSAGTTTVSGTCTVHAEMSKVRLTGDIAAPVEVDCITDATTYGGTFTASVNFNDQAILNLTATQTNNYMTPVSESDSVTYVIPPSDPALSITLQPGNPNFPTENPPHTAGVNPVISGTVVKGAGGTLELFTDNACNTKLDETVIGVGDSVNLTLDLDADGAYELYALVTMPTTHTNTSGCYNANLRFILDTQAPVVTLTSHDQLSSYLTNSTQTLVGACEDDLPVNLVVDGTSYTPNCVANTYSQAVTFPSVPKTMTVTFHQTDKANNTSINGSRSLTVVAPQPSALALTLQIADGHPLYTQTTPPTSKTLAPVLLGTVADADGGVMTVYADNACTEELGVSDPILNGEVTATLNFANDGSDDGQHDFYAIVEANSQSTNCINTGLSYILDSQISVTLTTFTLANNEFYPGHRWIQGTCSDNDKDITLTTTPTGAVVTTICEDNEYSAVVFLTDASFVDLAYEHDDLADNLAQGQIELASLSSVLPSAVHLTLDASITSVPVAPNKAVLFGECTHGDLLTDVQITITGDNTAFELEVDTPCYAINSTEYEGYYRIEVNLPDTEDEFYLNIEQASIAQNSSGQPVISHSLSETVEAE